MKHDIINRYLRHPWARFVELGEDTARYLAELIEAGTTDEDMETLAYDFGVTSLLREKPKDERKFPPPLKLPNGEAAANPYLTGNVKDQRALMVFDPELAEHYRRIAEEPIRYCIELDKQECERRTRNAWLAGYTREAHSKNPFVTGDKTLQGKFYQEHGRELTDIYIRESQPIDLSPIFSGRLDAKLNRLHPKLFEIVQKAKAKEAEFQSRENAKRQEEFYRAAERARRDRAALALVEKGLQMTRDGRLVGAGGGANKS
jgi:hypothetical protein